MVEANFEGRMPSLQMVVDHVAIKGRLPSVAGGSWPVSCYPGFTISRGDP